MTSDLKSLPRVFRGCMWDAHWEYDAPSVVYEPIQRYGYGGIVELVEDYCIDLAIAAEKGGVPRPGLSACDRKEFRWRGWRMDRMHNRANAWHLEVHIRWFRRDGEICFEIKKVTERFGRKSPRVR